MRKYFEVEENAKQFAEQVKGIVKTSYIPGYNYTEKVIYVEYKEV